MFGDTWRNKLFSIYIYQCAHLKIYYTLNEFKSRGQENSLKKFNKIHVFIYFCPYLLKINKKHKKVLDKFGNKYYNYPCKMLPGKSSIRRRHVFNHFNTNLSKLIKYFSLSESAEVDLQQQKRKCCLTGACLSRTNHLKLSVIIHP